MIREFLWAEHDIEAMRDATDFEHYEKSWLDYLHYLDRGWNKLEKLLAGISHQKLSHARQTRKSDALLSYLMHARNVDEHTIRKVVAKHPGSLKITGGPGGGTIDRGVFSGDGQVGNLVVASWMIVRTLRKQMRVRSVPVFHGPHRGFTLERRLG